MKPTESLRANHSVKPVEAVRARDAMKPAVLMRANETMKPSLALRAKETLKPKLAMRMNDQQRGIKMTEPTRDELKALIEKMGKGIELMVGDLHGSQSRTDMTLANDAQIAYSAYKDQQSPADELGLPWKVGETSAWCVDGRDGSTVCHIYGPVLTSIIKAAHIVRACNRDHLHDELVALVHDVCGFWHCGGETYDCTMALDLHDKIKKLPCQTPATTVS